MLCGRFGRNKKYAKGEMNFFCCETNVEMIGKKPGISFRLVKSNSEIIAFGPSREEKTSGNERQAFCCNFRE